MTDFTLRPLTVPERKYTYAQSSQLQGQTGNIGYLRGDFGSSGDQFYTTWFDTRPQWKSDEFKRDLDDVINALRSEEYGLLQSRSQMVRYGRENKESEMQGAYTTEFGFRADTEKYAFVLRCNPTRGDYNFYCLCYVKEWLDKHIEEANRDIRFIDSHYMVKTCGSFTEVKKPEHALKLFVRFAIAKGAITYGMELMLALFNIVQGTISTIMGSAGFSTPQQTVLPPELITSVEECGFFESIPLWAVTLIGGLFITVMSFILIMTVYGRFFKLYMYTALAPIPLSTFAGEPSQNVGKSFIKSYCAVCLEGAVIVLSCIIFSLFASSPPVVNPDAAAVTQVWSYIGELLFNMLVLVGSVKMSDRIIREMMGL